MKQIFVNTSDLVAVFNRRDQLHEKAVLIEKDIRNVRKVTTELILIEVLNYFSEFRGDIKEYVTDSIGRYLTEDKIDIVLCSSEPFRSGFEFYSSRLDKGYSLTDCVSMNVMREKKIT